MPLLQAFWSTASPLLGALTGGGLVIAAVVFLGAAAPRRRPRP